MVPGPHPDTRVREPLFDIDPRTGAAIEVFYADRALETFGRCGAGWFWWSVFGRSSSAGSPAGSRDDRGDLYRNHE